MTNKPKDQEKEKDAERRDETLKRMLKTPPKPHKSKDVDRGEVKRINKD